MMSKKRVAVSTWCTDDYREYMGIENLTNSISYFHPEIDHHIASYTISKDEQLLLGSHTEAARRGVGSFNMAPTCLEFADDYDMVIHIDGDAVVVGDLNEMILSDADVIGTLNNNVLGKAGANAAITTELMKYDEENNTYIPTGGMVPTDAWLNAGIIAANNKQFWQSWHDLNMTVCKRLKDYNMQRLPAPFGDENDTLNVVFHSGKFSTYIVDVPENNVAYNISNAWGDEPFSHWDSWKSLYMKENKVYLNNPVSGEPCQIKILHQAGGDHASRLNREHGGFRNWLRQAVSGEVSEFIDYISHSS